MWDKGYYIVNSTRTKNQIGVFLYSRRLGESQEDQDIAIGGEPCIMTVVYSSLLSTHKTTKVEVGRSHKRTSLPDLSVSCQDRVFLG